MRDAEFRDWLSRRSYNGEPLTTKGVNNRVRKAPRIERALKELGFEESDLDKVHSSGRWPDLVEAVRRVAADWHSNEEAARKMAPQAPDPTRQLANLINVARQYGHFADGKDPNYDADADVSDSDEIDEAALEALRDRFLARYPDFESGGGFSGKSSYHLEEDDYKRPLIEKVRAIRSGSSSARDVGSALLSLLLDDNDMNLIGDYRRKNHLKDVRERSDGAFEDAVGELALSEAEPPQAAAAFAERAWPLVLAGKEHSKPYSDIRVLATLPQALVRPGEAISTVTRKFDNLSHALLGRPLFGNNVLTADEYETALVLSAELFSVMEEWGWHPRDLWDVQGFVWVTCEEKLDMEEGRPADRVRAHAMENYIVPARARGDRTVAIRAGDVHNALGMSNAHANVCQALRGNKFREMAGLDLPSQTGPDNSSTTTFTYSLQDQSQADGSRSTSRSEPTNLILYGPPGTGKTYATAAEAVRLCGEPVSEERSALMAQYEALIAERRIAFVTFHQSFSYEDFVEGLRPVVPIADGEASAAGFTLQAEPGIFRQLAERAQTARGRNGEQSLDLTDRPIYKMSLGEVADSASDFVFEESLSEGYALLGFNDIDWSDPRFEEREEIFEAVRKQFPDQDLTPNKGVVRSPDVFRNQLQIGDVLIAAKGNYKFRGIGVVEGEYEYAPRPDGRYCHRRKVRWLWSDPAGRDVTDIYPPRFVQSTIYRLKDAELDRPALAELVAGASQDSRTTEQLHHVLIVDEINRANISKVFGELITLLEPDKRLGMPNALTVRLPYSKRDFGVPANLHIVGTMNTADRSIALLDTALRRRFRFRELAPNTKVPAFQDAVRATGLPLDAVLEAINERIEYLIDREHRIGHAFFIGCRSRADVDAAMRDKIIPLLQEYFFEDWSRVAAVLGERRDTGGAFLDGRKLRDPTGNDGQDRVSWSVRTEFAPDAYERLIGKVPPQEPSVEVPV